MIMNDVWVELVSNQFHQSHMHSLRQLAMQLLAPEDGGDVLLGESMAGEYVSEVQVGLINGESIASASPC